MLLPAPPPPPPFLERRFGSDASLRCFGWDLEADASAPAAVVMDGPIDGWAPDSDSCWALPPEEGVGPEVDKRSPTAAEFWPMAPDDCFREEDLLSSAGEGCCCCFSVPPPPFGRVDSLPCPCLHLISLSWCLEPRIWIRRPLVAMTWMLRSTSAAWILFCGRWVLSAVGILFGDLM